MTNMDKNRLKKYLIITFLITWTCWWGEALLVKSTALTATDILPMILFTIGGFGPTVAACVCMEGGFNSRNLKGFLFNNTRRNWFTILIAVLIVTVVFFVCSEGLVSSIPRSPIAVIVIIVIFLQATILYGGNEELGWRGTLLPILEKGTPAPIATLVVSIVWIIWHIPLWFIEGNSHQNMSFVSFAILGIALSYWLSAIFDVTGAVVFCMILHGWINTLMGVVSIKEDLLYYIVLATITGIAIVVSCRKQQNNKDTSIPVRK